MYEVTTIKTGFSKVYAIQGQNGIVLVDTGLHGSENVIFESLKNKGMDKKDIRYIFLTHGHSDHYGNASLIKKETDAKIIIHKNDAHSLENGSNAELQPTGLRGKLFGLFLKENSGVPGINPDIVLENEESAEIMGLKGRIIYTPGHTSGSISLILDDGKAFVGDLLMDSFPIKGKPSIPIFAYDINKVRESILKLKSFKTKKIYISHGGPFEAEEVYQRLASHK